MRATRVTSRAFGRALAAVVLLFARPAAPDALRLRYEPLFTVGETSTTDASGATQESSRTAWAHVVNARLDRAISEFVRLSASANLDWGLGSESSDGTSSQFDSRAWNTHAQLSLGPRELNLAPYYTRTERSFDRLEEGSRSSAPRRLGETYGAYATWRPEGLPVLGARIARTEQEEGGGLVLDNTATQASIEAIYVLATADLRYRLDYDDAVSHLSGTETVNVRHQARASYADRFLADRVAASGSYVLNLATTDTKVSGSGLAVDVRQAPVGGLSAIEAPPATPTSIALVQTPALVDGDRISTVGVDLGFGGDTRPRHIGAQLANEVTPVSLVYVWVQQPLPDSIARAFSWTAYQSVDNLTWTPVAIPGIVEFGTFDNRFEIPIERTAARYLKVVTRPLPPGTTLDPRFADILVTEIELLDRIPAADLRGRTSRTNGAATALVRAKLLADRRLFYDFGVNVTHASQELATSTDDFVTWDVTNGLSYDQALGRVFNLSTRVDRTDSRQRSREQSVTRVLATLGAAPFPALTSSATYTGALTQAPEGRLLSNTVLASLQAQPYQGIAVQANASYGINSHSGTTTYAHSESVTTMVTPHPAFTLTGAFTQSSAREDVAGRAQQSTRLLEGGATFAPVQALYLAASVGRVEVGDESHRVANVTLNVRPFPRGAIYLSLRYDEAFDSSFDTRTRTWGPSLRWNIHRGNYLEASYSVQESSSSLLENHLSLFAARLSVSL